MALFRNKYRIESARLPGWDYSNPGHYFVTICTYDHGNLLGIIDKGVMTCNKYGRIVHDEWQITGNKHNHFRLDEFMVMPNHMHAIRLLNESDEPVVFLPMEKVSINGKLDCSEKKKYKDVCNGYSYFRKNDVVVAIITPCFENGKGAFLNELDTDFGFGTTEFITIRPSKYLLGEYLRLFLSSNWFLKIAENYMTGSAGQKRISSDFIANFKVGLPDANQQKEILYSLKSKTNNLDQMINRTEREISLIQEYRTRLIADVVTGKVDVRDIVVPETVEEDIIEAESTEDAIEPVEEEVAEPVE